MNRPRISPLLRLQFLGMLMLLGLGALAARLWWVQVARGAEWTGGSYAWLDLTALGRQEEWEEPKDRADLVRAAEPDFAT